MLVRIQPGEQTNIGEYMQKRIYFKLLRPMGIYPVGWVFDCYDGLVYGVGDKDFIDKTWFKPVKLMPSTVRQYNKKSKLLRGD